MFKKVLLLICCTLPLIAAPPKIEMSGPLDGNAIKALVSGNTMIGTTATTHSLYELYFEPSGKLFFRKNSDKKQFYVGKWSVTGSTIHSEWPTYPKKTNAYDMEYFRLYDNAYVYRNVNPTNEPEWGPPFLVIKGKHTFVEDANP